ncbi:MAG: type II toxin-antitoxin system RelE/ParE family toxin [Candidatus Eremiobacteraeota bacterium]|nr:type II toxin-antitoxin system RelE/ParE family toxin [Candidatus Eremiobacteraeota bacterium]
MSFEVQWQKQARKALRKLHPSIQEQVWREVDKLKNETARVKKMARPGEEYCARAGDYRILFEVEGETIVIQEIGHRKEIYR